MTTNKTWMTDYPEEVLAWMRQREAKHLNYNGKSPQLASRGELVDLICMVTEHLKLSVATTHLAVHLLDRFMDSHFILENQLKLTALTVIMLADRAFMQWPTSLVAAACVACGRLSSNFEPIWSATLETTTGYTIQSLSQIMDLFLRMYRSEKKNSTCSTPESGYGSRCPSLQGSP
ncbi:cyclin-J-like protein isoform X3 [Scylla paramamosain]|uniref:cyclin-J-like protein isoform X3 n=1 Tax=Scylla paramamosain TaxID=85552 RepID=UPI003083D43E